MFHEEIIKTISSTKRKIIILYMILVPLIDLFLVNINAIREMLKYHQEYNNQIKWEWIYHPVLSSFLAGNSRGHITQGVYIWMLPIVLLLFYSDGVAKERKQGLSNIYISKVGKRRYIKVKLMDSFLFSMFLAGVPVVINFIVANIIYRKGTYLGGYDQEFVKQLGGFFGVQLKHIYITYMVFICLFSVIAGICGLFCQAVILLSKSIRNAYIVCFMFWVAQFAVMPTLDIVCQPFTEYGLNDIVLSFFRLTSPVVAFSIYTYYWSIKHDEI